MTTSPPSLGMTSHPPTPPPTAGTDAFIKHCRRSQSLHPKNDTVGKEPLYSRKDFYRLSFPADVTTHQRISWKNKYQNDLRHDVGIPTRNLAALSNIYVRRSNKYIINKLQQGHYGGISFVSSDEPSRNSAKKYRHFILRGFPADEEFNELKQNLGSELTKHVFKLLRIKRDGRPTTSVRLIWKSHDENPPEQLALYKDMPESPDMTLEEVEPLPPICNSCNMVGHIMKYCRNQDGIDSFSYGDTERRQERNNSSVPERNRTVPSGNQWLQGGPHRGTTLQRVGVSKEGEGSNHQEGYKAILQEIKEMRAEINSLKAEKEMNSMQAMKNEINSMREEIRRQREIINMMNQSPLSLMEDSDNDHPLITTDPIDSSLVDGLHKSDSGEKEEEENEDGNKCAGAIMEDITNETGNDGIEEYREEKEDDNNDNHSESTIKIGNKSASAIMEDIENKSVNGGIEEYREERGNDKSQSAINHSESTIKSVPPAGVENKNEEGDEIPLQGVAQPSPIATRARKRGEKVI